MSFSVLATDPVRCVLLLCPFYRRKDWGTCWRFCNYGAEEAELESKQLNYRAWSSSNCTVLSVPPRCAQAVVRMKNSPAHSQSLLAPNKSPTYSHSSGHQRSVLGKLVRQERSLLTEVFAIIIELRKKKQFCWLISWTLLAPYISISAPMTMLSSGIVLCIRICLPDWSDDLLGKRDLIIP